MLPGVYIDHDRYCLALHEFTVGVQYRPFCCKLEAIRSFKSAQNSAEGLESISFVFLLFALVHFQFVFDSMSGLEERHEEHPESATVTGMYEVEEVFRN